MIDTEEMKKYNVIHSYFYGIDYWKTTISETDRPNQLCPWLHHPFPASNLLIALPCSTFKHNRCTSLINVRGQHPRVQLCGTSWKSPKILLRQHAYLRSVLLSCNHLGRHPVRCSHHGGTLALLRSDLSAEAKVSYNSRMAERQWWRSLFRVCIPMYHSTVLHEQLQSGLNRKASWHGYQACQASLLIIGSPKNSSFSYLGAWTVTCTIF